MQMTDLSFLLYFLPGMLAVYFLLSFSRKAQNLWLAIGCLALYAFGSMANLMLLVVMTMANYYLGYAAQKRQEAGKPARAIVVFTVALNILPLLFFRYLPPAARGIAGLLGMEAPSFSAAPFGMAILALQGISYVVDISRGNARWSNRFTDAIVYLAFFPPLQAGPLLRYRDIAPQIAERKISFEKAAKGLGRFVIGLAKLALLAGTLLTIANIAFEQSNNSGVYTNVPVTLALLGLVCYALGLYHYLSGFSDLVIGLGSILGFEYKENFSHPILASSMTSFWKRCFTSLEGWFDEYVYKPLGKRRSNNDHMVYHLLLMWVLIGLWAGFGLPGIIFGVLSFIFILIERIVEIDEKKESKNPLRHLYVLCVVLISLVALRSDTIYQFTLFIANLFGMRGNGFYSDLAWDLLKESWHVLALGLVCCFPIGAKLKQLGESRGHVLGKLAYIIYPVAMIALAALVFMALSHASYDPNQFIRLQVWR